MESIISLMSSLGLYFNVFVLILAIIGIGIRVAGLKRRHKSVNFKCSTMPLIKPIAIRTKGKSIFEGLWVWLFSSRKWELQDDWYFDANGNNYVIYRGFVFDGVSVPRFLTVWFSPIGILLIGALVHDYLYLNGYINCLQPHTINKERFDRKRSDQFFRDICIDVNGFFSLNYIAYYIVRLGGWVYWNKHQK